MATRTAWTLRGLTLVARVGLFLMLLGDGSAYATGLPANPKFSPTALTFGRVHLGASSIVKTVTITNPNTQALNLASTSVSSPFTLVGSSCGSSISAGGSCMLSLSFNPIADTNTSGTTETGKVTIGDNGKTNSQTVGLSGTGYGTLPTPVSFVSPTIGQTVGGSISVALSFSTAPSTTNPESVWWTQLSVDGVPVVSGYNNLPWDTTTVSNGSHSLRVDGYAYNGTASIGNATISVKVSNSATSTPIVTPTATSTSTVAPTLTPTITPTLTATATPSSAQTPTATTTVHATPTATPAACVSITSPAPNTAVSGIVAINTNDACAGNWFESLYVDGAHVADFATGQVTFTSTTYSNGNHTVQVTSQSVNPGSVVLGSASETLNVQTGLPTTTATTTHTATPSATPTPAGHYSMMGPGATLPTEAECVSAVNASPIAENAPWNQDDGTGFNSNLPPAGGVPSYFYANAPCCNEMPSADFANVDGNYSGSTDDLIRITACKWGIDEDYIRSQAWIESDWHQDCAAAHGGSGCNEGGDMNNPGGDPSGLAVTAISPGGIFSAFNGFGDPGGSSDHYDSWSIVQTKVYYAWMTWPMMEESTPFGLDYRYAEMRGCVNGDEYTYYNSQSSAQGSDYQNAVNAARSNPNGASSISGWSNLQYLSYGCIDTHFSGDWFDGSADSYLNEFLDRLSTAPWPGGLR